ncbi:hypothetical protein EBT16_02710, partial [bacterium]|nr:hypothetical protein [bacterium]
SNEIEREKLFNLIHIDGEHSEHAVLEDLTMADKFASRSDNSIIIIDDVFVRHYPGVTNATFDFIKRNEKDWLITEFSYLWPLKNSDYLLRTLDLSTMEESLLSSPFDPTLAILKDLIHEK